MNVNMSKLRIRIGEVEIDYEGTEHFLKEEIPSLMKTAMELHGATERTLGGGGNGARPGAGLVGAIGSLTTGSIAAKLDAKSGSDLLIAAAGRLALVDKKDTFSRQQLLDEMKGATAYYNKNYSSNLSSYIKRALEDDRLAETATNVFALTAAARADLEKKFADA